MGGDSLGLASLADHEELWKDGHGLQVDGEGPQDLKNRRPASAGRGSQPPHTTQNGWSTGEAGNCRDLVYHESTGKMFVSALVQIQSSPILLPADSTRLLEFSL